MLANSSLSSRESDTKGVRSEDEHSVATSSSSFTLSGLLGESHFLIYSTFGAFARTRTSNQSLGYFVGEPSLPSFAPSGLLNGTQSAHLSTPILAGYAARPSDVDPPPVAEAFGVPSHLLSNSGPTHTRPKNATHLSVRATTFDGKTIYLRRRTKVISRSSTVSYDLPSFDIPNLLNSQQRSLTKG